MTADALALNSGGQSLWSISVQSGFDRSALNILTALSVLSDSSQQLTVGARFAITAIEPLP